MGSSRQAGVAIGVDYGTASGRVLVLDLEHGEEIGHAVVPYAHGVIDDRLPGTGEKLPPDFALQHPDDYLDVLRDGIPAALKMAGVGPEAVIGLGVDVTSCTVIPVDSRGTPLALLPQWRGHPHAWPKLWKHHAAQAVADRMNAVAVARQEEFLSRYGGRISSEWYFPKLIEILEEDPDVYRAMARFVEATDWIVWQLTGREQRNSCTAGYKALWSAEDGLPSPEYFRAVSSGLTDPAEKLGTVFFPVGTPAGCVTPERAAEFGLTSATVVAVGNVDAMVSAPAVGLRHPGTLVMVMGTSICHLAVTQDEVRLPGVTGVVRDGVLPGWFGYEAGQAAVGDMFQWFVETSASGRVEEAAHRSGKSVYAGLEEEAGRLRPGEAGVVALDWWNGNRSILADADLSGVMAGLTLATTPAARYRALLEASAFGTRRIVENFAEHGIVTGDLIACGGLALRSPLLMQIYADVTGLPVAVPASEEIPARGAAIFGALSAGAFSTLEEASARLAAPTKARYTPDPSAGAVYDELYAIYRRLYELFGQEETGILHGLKRIRLAAGGSRQTL